MRDAAFEQLLVTWLAEGPVRPPDGPVEAAVTHARSHAPRRPRPAWWRFPMGSTRGIAPAPAAPLAPSWGWILVVALVTVAVVGMLVAAGGWGRAAPSLVPATAPAVVPPVGSPTPAATPAVTATPDSTAIPVPTSSPDWTAPPTGRIAFVRDGDIWVVDPASGEPTRNLTATADVREAAAAWSPDGTRLAYLVEKTDSPGPAGGSGWTVYALWTMDADGGDARRLFPALEPGGGPIRSHLDLSWSPDGQVVGWTRYPSMALAGATLVDVDGGYRDFPATMEWRVTKSGFQNPVISPDGSRVAFSTSLGFHTPGAPGVYVAGTDLDGTDPPMLLEATIDAGDVTGESIGWLDPAALIFVADDRLWEIQADGTNLVRLSPMDLRVEHALASPDGSAIALIAGGRVYVMSTDGTRTASGVFPAGLLEAIGGVCDLPGSSTRTLAWSPDGRHVAFEAAADGGCALAWVPARAVLAAADRWGTPDFFDPDVWDRPVEVKPTITDERIDAAPISWGP